MVGRSQGSPAVDTRNINLWRHRLGHVPETVWEQIDLETLVLADNDLAEVSAKIGRLKRLRTLDLGHNVLSSLPRRS
jgi:Leucine-rich repeat (LRR) protein